MVTPHNSSTIYNDIIISQFQCKLQFKLQLLFCTFTTIRAYILQRWFKVQERFTKMV